MDVRVQEAAFGFGAELDAFTDRADGAGAVVGFSGIVRNDGGAMTQMVIEHYPGMTEKALAKITREAITRWSLTDALVIHRYGPMVPGDKIMMAATASRHRSDAFAAAEFMMDYLKSRAPCWKKETNDGGDTWVAAKDDDETALDRW